MANIITKQIPNTLTCCNLVCGCVATYNAFSALFEQAFLFIVLGAAFDPARSIGVIVPYRNQIAVIRREAERFGMPELEAVSIDTVERYQGSQRDVIIYSFTVQSEWQLEFLAGSCFDDGGHTIDRKLNVALTRARRQTIMTGNAATLGLNPVFKRLMEYVREKGGVL